MRAWQVAVGALLLVAGVCAAAMLALVAWVNGGDTGFFGEPNSEAERNGAVLAVIGAGVCVAACPLWVAWVRHSARWVVAAAVLGLATLVALLVLIRSGS
jgi:hypothetical protein